MIRKAIVFERHVGLDCTILAVFSSLRAAVREVPDAVWYLDKQLRDGSRVWHAAKIPDRIGGDKLTLTEWTLNEVVAWAAVPDKP